MKKKNQFSLNGKRTTSIDNSNIWFKLQDFKKLPEVLSFHKHPKEIHYVEKKWEKLVCFLSWEILSKLSNLFFFL